MDVLLSTDGLKGSIYCSVYFAFRLPKLALVKTNVKFFYRTGKVLMDEWRVYLRDVANPAVFKNDIDSFIIGVVEAVFRFSSEDQEGGILLTQRG